MKTNTLLSAIIILVLMFSCEKETFDNREDPESPIPTEKMAIVEEPSEIVETRALFGFEQGFATYESPDYGEQISKMTFDFSKMPDDIDIEHLQVRFNWSATSWLYSRCSGRKDEYGNKPGWYNNRVYWLEDFKSNDTYELSIKPKPLRMYYNLGLGREYTATMWQVWTGSTWPDAFAFQWLYKVGYNVDVIIYTTDDRVIEFLGRYVAGKKDTRITPETSWTKDGYVQRLKGCYVKSMFRIN